MLNVLKAVAGVALAFVKKGASAALFVASPFSSVFSVFLSLINNPIGRALIYAGLAVCLWTAGDIHGHVKEHQKIEAQSKKDAANAVAEANQARDAALKKFDNGRFTVRPHGLSRWVRHGSDGFARD